MTTIIEPTARVAEHPHKPLAIETKGLLKTFGTGTETLKAVDGVDLAIETGTIYALLGPNGAGKTTTMNMLTTLITPSGGTARVGGYDVVRQAANVRRIIGVTFQETVVEKSLSGRDALETHGRLYAMPKAEIRARVEELVKLVELENAIDRAVKTYSGGMKRRLELARGLMTRPQVLFLDEPTLGLDPQNRDRIWAYISQLRTEQGLTILVTTHYMDEAEGLADRVGIIDGGKIVAEGSPQELISSMGADVVTIVGTGLADEFVKMLQMQNFVGWARAFATENQVQIGLQAQAGRSLRPIIELAERSGYTVGDISIKRPSLNDVFLNYTGRRLRD